ncbi:sulfurtransferase [Corynebacterium amycolatum]|uniref:sulfurtransferase n=1 Tax=Corynebacterium amycolatum TaxID=43765 RepID=UPI0011EC90B5|nr:sulfurtransferase [Corynebacterium amycolatum]KAA0885373.1 sulfurtransferase [Corynebacterium amycolatum]
MTTSISVQELRDKIAGGGRIVVVDARWSRAKKPYDSYATAHIPLAVFCDPELDLAGVPSREAGRNPLPDIERVRDAVRRWGVRSEHLVIVYDAGDGLFASRAWWILRWAGLENVRVLTGGLAAWEADGNETAFGPGNLPRPGTIAVSEGNMPVASLDDVRTWSERGILVDAREPSRFEGRSERVDLQAGHIPGAVNLAARSLQNAEGSFLPVEQLRERFASVGIEDGRNVAVYSGSGLHSSLFIQAMEEAGITGAALYVGGWSQWAGDPSLPIVRF